MTGDSTWPREKKTNIKTERVMCSINKFSFNFHMNFNNPHCCVKVHSTSVNSPPGRTDRFEVPACRW